MIFFQVPHLQVQDPSHAATHRSVRRNGSTEPHRGAYAPRLREFLEEDPLIWLLWQIGAAPMQSSLEDRVKMLFLAANYMRLLYIAFNWFTSYYYILHVLLNVQFICNHASSMVYCPTLHCMISKCIFFLKDNTSYHVISCYVV